MILASHRRLIIRRRILELAIFLFILLPLAVILGATVGRHAVDQWDRSEQQRIQSHVSGLSPEVVREMSR